MTEGVRLQKVLAAAGVASRRACEVMISEGRVEVNGTVVTEQGVRVDPDRDVVRLTDPGSAAAPAFVSRAEQTTRRRFNAVRPGGSADPGGLRHRSPGAALPRRSARY